MVFGWSQNIQRRLLLYVLQQISLFSNLDLTNLDVSLGANSVFTFTDIDLSVTDINIPYLRVNSGSVGKLTLQLTVSGGLDIKGSDVSFDISLLDTQESRKSGDNIDTTLPNLLMKSMHDLTTSVIQLSNETNINIDVNDLGELIEETEENITEESRPESEQSQLPLTPESNNENFSKGSQPTRMQNMRNKVLGTILSKLTLDLSNITVSITDDKNDDAFQMHLQNVQLLTNEQGIRNIIISSLQIFYASKDTNSESNENMEGSMYYSKMGGTSVYMSALDIPHTQDTNSLGNESDMEFGDQIMGLKYINISFKGLTSIDDVKITDLLVDIREIMIEESNIVQMNADFVSYLLELLNNISQGNSSKKTQTNIPIVVSKTRDSESYKRFQEEQHILSPNELSYICIEKVFIKLSFNISLEVNKLYMNQLENKDYTVEISSFNLTGDGITVSKQENPIIKVLLKQKEYIINITDALNLSVSPDRIKDLITVTNDLKLFIFNLGRKSNTKYHNGISKKQDNNTFVSISTDDVSLSLVLPEYKLTILSDPIRFNSRNNVTIIPSLRLVKHDDQIMTEILTFLDIKFTHYSEKFEITSFNEALDPIILSSYNRCDIKSISLKESKDVLKDLYDEVNEVFNFTLSSPIEKGSPINKNTETSPPRKFNSMKKSVRILNSSGIIYRKSIHAQVVLDCESIKFKINNFMAGTKFGHLKGKLQKNILALLVDSNDIIFHTAGFNVDRLFSDEHTKQNIVTLIKPIDPLKPSIYLLIKRNPNLKRIKILLRNLSWHYYSDWIYFFNETSTDKDPTLMNDVSGVTYSKSSYPFEIELKFFDSSILMHPFRLKAGLLILIDQYTSNYSTSKRELNGIIKTTSLLLIDDVKNCKLEVFEKKYKSLISYYSQLGFSVIGKINILKLSYAIFQNSPKLHLNPEEIELSLCADSFHSLIQLLIDLKVPETFPDILKFKPELFSNIDTFEDINFSFLDAAIRNLEESSVSNISNSIGVVENFLDNSKQLQSSTDLTSLHTDSTDATGINMESLHFDENYIDSQRSRNYLIKETEPERSNNFDAMGEKETEYKTQVSFKIRKIDIKLYDGFDWKYSRKLINDTMVSLKQMTANGGIFVENNEQNDVMNGASIFESIYVTPQTKQLHSVPYNVYDERNDGIIDIENTIKMNLRPSKNYQVLIQMLNVELNFISYDIDNPSQEDSDDTTDILNKMLLSVDKFEIIDNVATSSWNKFATELHGGLNPQISKMFRLEFLITRPIDYLKSIDYRLDIGISPLRLHIDQDTLDFITRVFEFKDPRFELIDEYPEVPFINKLHLKPVRICLDYKPKSVDYTSLRSGHSSEFINFFVLDGAKITLKEVTLYGINGLEMINTKLKEIWTPDIVSKQLGGVVGGLAPIKSFFTLGSDVKTFVTVLLSDYKSGQPMSTSFKKNGNVFIKTTTGDFIKLGVKLSSGTQAFLESTEEKLGGQGMNSRGAKVDQDTIEQLKCSVLDYGKLVSEDQLVGGTNPRIHSHEPTAIVIEPGKIPGEETKIISLYADQPLDLHQGLEEAYYSLEKHFNIAYDAIWKTQQIPESNYDEEPQSNGAKAAVVSVMKATPIAIIRPLIGVTEALSKTFQGMSNQIDKQNINEMKDKYKSKGDKDKRS
ncbi:similar to Saccharomyces cerevisiae YNL242W ATG2 Peripheral membrane protein required for vesicle formation during autophagy [Maudiozyma saulgeensis]|uniref:Autophagy-related protein 2 n=1 Tax=Maudiozyma saulgeensis TaxID=1789683 RepID=A0A1X7R237_9SACH|nr:similar to Saccharomyces cerevisiae YNL242W ATG2 Peripheral membrane protein required for vesicle formation during autophagy [Kazachstania saulgeensis]